MTQTFSKFKASQNCGCEVEDRVYMEQLIWVNLGNWTIQSWSWKGFKSERRARLEAYGVKLPWSSVEDEGDSVMTFSDKSDGLVKLTLRPYMAKWNTDNIC
jgi:hypothetical protein